MKKLTNTWKQQKSILRRNKKISKFQLDVIKKTLSPNKEVKHDLKQSGSKRKASNDGPINPKRNYKIVEFSPNNNELNEINRQNSHQEITKKIHEKEISINENKKYESSYSSINIIEDDNEKNKINEVIWKTPVNESSNSMSHALNKFKEFDSVRHKNECNGIKSQKNDEVQNIQCLSAWSLPQTVVQKYAEFGVREMFKWQAECLLTGEVLNGGNLVYSAPTSAGKTIVAEILMLKKVLEFKRKAIMVLPFVAVAREKMFYFQKLFFEVGIRVDGYMGCHSPAGGFDTVDIAICTIEKANGLINRLLEENRLQQIGILVIDELHMLGDSHRGYLLELLLTKILYISKKHHLNNKIQIIGMSATLPNLEILAHWLEADLYTTDFRPVPLHELIKIGSTIYDCATLKEIRCLNSLPMSFQNDVDHTIYLSIETVVNGHSVLIFCPSKIWCEKLAENIAKEIFRLGNFQTRIENDSEESTLMGIHLREQLNCNDLSDVLEQLRRCPAGLDNTLLNTIKFGVAFHHAGLTFDERDIIEGAFKQGFIRVLVATSTLSSGVNLPARRVIIRSPMFCGSVIDVLTYKQMAGRAGRKGKDTEGESLLICKETESFQAKMLIKSSIPSIQSCLVGSGDFILSNSVKRAILEIIASGIASTPEEVELYSSCTLAAVSQTENKMQNVIDHSLKYLVENEFIHLQNSEKDETKKVYKPTKLGQAVLASSMSPDESLRVLKELQQARKCFVLENELHLLYQVTPPFLSDQVQIKDWLHYLNLWEHLSEDMKKVGELVGVEERFIARAVRGQYFNKSSYQAHKLAVHQHFYVALALNDLINEIPIAIVANKYDFPRGMLQSFQQNASTFAGMVTIFCNRLGWTNIELLIKQFQKRLHFGIQHELCELIRLNSLNAHRARALFDSGFESISSLATANVNEIEMILKNSVPFQSAKPEELETEYELKKRHQAHIIWITGQKGMTEKEAAKMIIEEARQIVQLDLGIEIKDWSDPNSKSIHSDSITNKSENLKLLNENIEISINRGKNISSFNNVINADLKETQFNNNHLIKHKDGNNINSQADKSIYDYDIKHNKTNLTGQENEDVKEQIQINNNDGFKIHSNIIDISDSFLLDSQTDKLLNAVESNNNQRYSIDSGKGFSHNCLFSDKSSFEDEVFFEKMKSESPLQNQNVFSVSNCNKLVKNINSICNNNDSKSAENLTETNIIIKTHDLQTNSRRHSYIKWYDDNVSLTFFSDKSSTNDDNFQLNSNSNSIFSTDSGNICDNEVELQTDLEKNSIFNSSSSNNLISKTSICEKNVNTSATNFILLQSPLQEFTKLMSQNKKILTSTPISNISCNRHKSMLENMIRSCHSPNYSSASSSNDCISPTPPKTLMLRYSNESEIYTNISACISNKYYSMSSGNEVEYIDFNDLFTEEIESSISKSSQNVYEKIYLSSGELLQVIDVGNNYKLFKKFLSEWKKKTKFSFCLVSEKIMYNHCFKGIGCNMQKETNNCYSEKNNVVGICVYWNNRNIFYLPFSSNEIDYRLTTDEKLREVQHILEFTERKRKGIAFDIKEQYKILCKKYGILLDSSGKTKWQDPKIADWLLDSGTKEKSLQRMVNAYLPQHKSLLDVIEKSSSVRSLGLLMNDSNKKHNAAIEAFLCFHLMDKLFKEMEDRHLTKAFTEIEMPTLLILGKMELNGLGFDPNKAEQFQQMLENHLQQLTEEAHKLAKHKFSLNSPQEISKVLFKELKLTSTDKLNNKIRKTVQHQSTAKQHLLKLRSLHPLPDIILEWRKTNLALYKVVFPLLRKKTYTHHLDMIRLYSHCDIFTITGRINMFEPSLQTIPRDFDIKLFHDNDKISSMKSSSLVISLRCSFIPFKGALFLASDFSQLEIRLLAHLSNDQKLINLLNGGGDVFKIIASQWKNTSLNDVSDLDRQHAKQICYGMIYGIGIKALSDQLDMEEEKASSFMETFKATYPGIKRYTESVVNACRKQGFVETLYGRRRYLPSINSEIPHVRAKTERQAINTIIQGSAADLIKIAMIKINEKMEIIYPETKRPHQCLFSDHKIQDDPNRNLLQGGYLVLELHDELIYEVQEEDLEPVYALVKEGMESAVSLSVKLPVKIRVGSNWGDMKEWPKR